MRERSPAGSDAPQYEGTLVEARIAELQDCRIAGLRHRKIALIDYRAGNLTSVKKAFAAVGADLVVPQDPQALEAADAVVVPGVGHFAATRALTPEWIDAIRIGLVAGKPLLGICLGMQWLFEGSAEALDYAGLGLLAGHCYRLPASVNGAPLKIPHVGWNALDIRRPDSISSGCKKRLRPCRRQIRLLSGH